MAIKWAKRVPKVLCAAVFTVVLLLAIAIFVRSPGTLPPFVDPNNNELEGSITIF